MNRSRAPRQPVTAAVTPVEVELVDQRGRGMVVEAELRYLAEDPWAVRVAVPTTSGEVVWCFGRDLLAEGVHGPSGDGDVHVWPSLGASGLAVAVSQLVGSGDRSVHLEVQARAVHRFLEATATVVPFGAEAAHVDLDALVEELLGSAR